MKILVLGGSYFLGRYFVNIAKETNEITVFNRGNSPFNDPEVTEVRGDRHDKASFVELKGEHFDAVVDFCAYGPGDIETLFEALNHNFNQYIFISTVDVYERGLGRILDENAPFETRNFGGNEGAYILGKVALEGEIRKLSEKHDVKYTVLRPAIIYGPGNYAPREGIYFNWIEAAGQILHPADATGEFQMVYVGDVAKAILNSLGNPEAYNEAFNITDEAMITYDSFAEALKESSGKPFDIVSIDVKTVIDNGIPLPFPLTREESNYYTGKKSLKIISGYTKLPEGLKNK